MLVRYLEGFSAYFFCLFVFSTPFSLGHATDTTLRCAHTAASCRSCEPRKIFVWGPFHFSSCDPSFAWVCVVFYYFRQSLVAAIETNPFFLPLFGGGGGVVMGRWGGSGLTAHMFFSVCLSESRKPHLLFRKPRSWLTTCVSQRLSVLSRFSKSAFF